MDRDDREDTGVYKVVVNHEEQYSIWPVERANALGWRDAGKSGTKAECLSYIKEVWTDMRPLSLRRKMEEAAARSDQRGSVRREMPAAHVRRGFSPRSTPCRVPPPLAPTQSPASPADPADTGIHPPWIRSRAVMCGVGAW
jgi:MbtH protein